MFRAGHPEIACIGHAPVALTTLALLALPAAGASAGTPTLAGGAATPSGALAAAADAPVIGGRALKPTQTLGPVWTQQERADQVLDADWQAASRRYTGSEVEPRIDADLTRVREADAVPVPLPTSALGGMALLGAVAAQRAVRRRRYTG